MSVITDGLVAIRPLVFAAGMVDECLTERIEVVPGDRIAAFKASQFHVLSCRLRS
jgi:hypothetical protein